jgi:hypothetical protein
MTTDLESVARHHHIEFVEDLAALVVEPVTSPPKRCMPHQNGRLYLFGRSLPDPIRLNRSHFPVLAKGI